MQELTQQTEQPQISIDQSATEIELKLIAPKNHHSLLLRIAFLVLVTGVAIYFYFASKENVQNVVVPTTSVVEQHIVASQKPTSTITNPTDDWKTYTNIDHNFSFKYPSTWKTENRSSNYELIAFSLDDNKSFFVTFHQGYSIQKWLDDNQAGRIIGKKQLANTLSLLFKEDFF